MLETLIFREIRYNGNNEKFLKEIQGKVAEKPEDIDFYIKLQDLIIQIKQEEMIEKGVF